MDVTIDLDHEAFRTGVERLRAGAADIADRRRRLLAEVEALLAGDWQGAAADSFDEAWQDWHDAAARTSQALVSMTDLLAAVHQDLTYADTGSELRLESVAARVAGVLDERLGR